MVRLLWRGYSLVVEKEIEVRVAEAFVARCEPKRVCSIRIITSTHFIIIIQKRKNELVVFITHEQLSLYIMN